MAVTETVRGGVVVERRASPSPWADHVWRVTSVLPDAPDMADWSMLKEEEGGTTFYAGSAEIEFHSGETQNLRDNLQSGRPSLWAVLEACDAEPGMRLVTVIADPGEAEAVTGTGDLLVEQVDMPAIIEAQLTAFVATHHVERAFVKRRRET